MIETRIDTYSRVKKKLKKKNKFLYKWSMGEGWLKTDVKSLTGRTDRDFYQICFFFFFFFFFYFHYETIFCQEEL